MVSKSKNQRNTQSRTFTGCGTCRSRHLKCDEARPTCGSCRRLGLKCQGYQSCLLWLADDAAGDGSLNQQHRAQRTQAYRYPLYSESKRKSLAAELSASTKGRTAMNLISQLDDYCQQHDGDGELPSEFRTGPFGVFEAKSSSNAHVGLTTAATGGPRNTPKAAESTALDADATSTNAIADPDTDVFACTEAGPLMSIPEDPPSNESSIEEIEHNRRYNSFDHGHDNDNGFDAVAGQTMSQHDLWQLDDPFSFMGDFGMPLDGGDFMLLDSFDAASAAFAMDNNAGIFGSNDPVPKPATPIVREHSDWAHLLTEAPSLLRCYQVDDAASEPAKQSFWKSFILPSAMRTFAELSVFGKASDVSSSVFYSTLANGAFSLQRSDGQPPNDSRWYTIGKSAEEAALYYLQSALRPGSETADCQDLLSAILSIALNSLYYEPDQTIIHLIEAERLIRSRKVPDMEKSFQFRALLHVYTYLRIIMESICFVTGRCNREIPNGSLGRFSVTEETLETGLDPTMEKTTEVGYNDIHLDVNGRWQETLYTKIYGVPETLLTLLSQTVKLANGKQRLEAVAISSRRVSEALRRHTKRLERNLWTLRLQEDSSNHSPPGSPLIPAVHQGLLIYFYRQVQKVDAMLLQDLVGKALDHLEPCLDDLNHGHDLTLLVAWTAFVVACEAATDSLQARALVCLTRVEACAAFFTIRKMSHIAQRVWERRQQTDDWTISWLDVAKD